MAATPASVSLFSSVEKQQSIDCDNWHERPDADFLPPSLVGKKIDDLEFKDDKLTIWLTDLTQWQMIVGKVRLLDVIACIPLLSFSRVSFYTMQGVKVTVEPSLDEQYCGNPNFGERYLEGFGHAKISHLTVVEIEDSEDGCCEGECFGGRFDLVVFSDKKAENGLPLSIRIGLQIVGSKDNDCLVSDMGRIG